MLSLITQTLFLTVIPAGLVLGSTPERLAVLLVAAVLLLRMSARRAKRGRRAVLRPKMTRSDYVILPDLRT
jgi:hypothetical protein